MPNLNGIEATREIRREAPSVRVIALSMRSAKACAQEVFRAGASAYVLKNSEFGELTRAVRAVVAGRTYLSPSLRSASAEEFARPTEKGAPPTAFSLLTPREREILRRLAEGGTTRHITLRLQISPKTVEAHRLRIMAKLKNDTVAQLTGYAIGEGLIAAEF
ncbi:MAG: response regulator transcription factor [Planctomycetes bacterium]|nr:response regulator transcription factor [Planctomycetota bacterium]